LWLSCPLCDRPQRPFWVIGKVVRILVLAAANPLNGGKHAARKIKRAQILLAADAGFIDEMIASSLSVSG